MSDFIVFVIVLTISIGVLALAFWSFKRITDEKPEGTYDDCGETVSILSLEFKKNKNGRFFWALVTEDLSETEGAQTIASESRIRSMSVNKRFNELEEAQADSKDVFGRGLHGKLISGIEIKA